MNSSLRILKSIRNSGKHFHANKTHFIFELNQHQCLKPLTSFLWNRNELNQHYLTKKACFKFRQFCSSKALDSANRKPLSHNPENEYIQPPVIVGEVRRLERCFSASDIEVYAKLGGDNNPIHLDAEMAKLAGFQGPIVHGMLYSGLFSTIIGTQFPGAIYLSQSLRFAAPVLAGEKLEAVVTVTDILPHRHSRFRVTFSTVCHKTSNQVVVLDGHAVALLPSVPKAAQFNSR